MYSDEKLKVTYTSHGNGSADAIKNAILNSLAGYQCNDDVTFLVIKRE